MMNEIRNIEHEEKIDRLLSDPKVVECIVCGKPTFNKQIWLPRELVDDCKKPLRCILYGLCEDHFLSEPLMQWIENRLIREFN